MEQEGEGEREREREREREKVVFVAVHRLRETENMLRNFASFLRSIYASLPPKKKREFLQNVLSSKGLGSTFLPRTHWQIKTSTKINHI